MKKQPVGPSEPVVHLKRNAPGAKRLAFYCDESGIGGNLKHYGFGALIMEYQRRGQFAQEFRELTRGNRYGEIKWTKTSAHTLPLYSRLVDYFFDSSWMYFHSIIVPRAWVNRELHNGSIDLARRKHFTQFIANKAEMIMSLDPSREYEFRIYVDPIPSSYKKADEAAEVIGNNLLRKHLTYDLKNVGDVLSVATVDSKEKPEVQMCDLLLGAVVAAWNESSTHQAKRALQCQIARRLGWADLRNGTYKLERKFNVWFLTDRFKSNSDRPVRARSLRLNPPLPPRRLYKN